MDYSQEQRQAARRELARRELARRQQSAPKENKEKEEDPGAYLDSLSNSDSGSIPRDILIGLSNLGHNTVNMPYNIAKGLESNYQGIGQGFNKNFPVDISQLKPSKDVVEEFNRKHNVPEKYKNPLYNQSFSEHIPHQEEHDYAALLGQEGEPSLMHKLIQKGVEYAPDIAGLTALARAGLSKFPITQRMAGKPFKQAEKLMQERNVGPLIKENKIPIEKYDVGNLFGVSHNSSDTVMPSNTIGMINEGNKARVMSSKVELNQRGKGIGKNLYKAAIDEATNKGLPFESDSVVSNDALNVYKALEKEGYKFKFNPKVKETKFSHEGNTVNGLASLNEDEPVVSLISKPEYFNKEEIKDLISNSKQYLDNTKETKRLLKDAETGDYEALFSLQSQLGKESRSLARSGNASERRIYREPQELKQQILNHMQNHLRQNGHGDIADLLKNGVSSYRNYAKIKDKIYPALRKLGIPTTFFTALVVGRNQLKKYL